MHHLNKWHMKVCEEGREYLMEKIKHEHYFGCEYTINIEFSDKHWVYVIYTKYTTYSYWQPSHQLLSVSNFFL